MPHTILTPKAVKKLLITFLAPLPIVAFICYVSNSSSLKQHLQTISQSYVHQIEEIVDELRDENYQALYDATTCRQIQKDLLFEAFLREMLIVEEGRVTCSSKRSEDEIFQIKHKFSESKLNTGEYLFDISYEDGPVRSLLIIDQDKNNLHRSAISIVDQSYIDVRLGLKDDDRIAQSVMTVSGNTYPSNTHLKPSQFLTMEQSKHLNIQVTIEPSNKLINELYTNTLLVTIPISLFLSIFWHLFSYWYQTRGSLAEKIKKALINNEFFLVYQPLVDSSTSKIKGVEALIRWSHPRSGFIGPDVFIPVAEQHGLINNITDFVFERTLVDWKTHTTNNLHISINVPPSYLSQNSCLEKLTLLASRYKEQGLKLGIEITERQLLDKSDRAILTDIKKLGIDVSIDDFGTGYTSLSVLEDTEFDYLKIDRCFINTIGIKSINSPVLNSIINLANNMNVLMVAEGVETKEQADYLKDHGVQLLQGYFFYKPMSFEEIATLLENN
ncbi:EAL domain-containing protein [Vibrio algivorus]|uniref:Cyclic diguanylate phosphodiesterase n=1 Tax=Vibrio algivorus TaxID=1667024 RepID=A0ABQ6ELG6_9VIBR|nr:EAL domain-containing protein [Vibrio algivorus]GLT13621.1 cyclic diguanylate phosphodiesterase [Vibrio algivorus]